MYNNINNFQMFVIKNLAFQSFEINVILLFYDKFSSILNYLQLKI